MRGLILAFIILALACSTTVTTTSQSAEGLITASSGGVIRTSGGIVLEVPPEAVTSDVNVTVIPITASALALSDPAVIVGARFEPDGLELRKPAILRLPLPSAGVGAAPIELVFRGSDPKEALESGIVANVSDGYAVLSVWHFSGNICATNCHGGTREFLAKKLAAKGLDLKACVTSKYAKDMLPAKCEDLHSEQAVQAILGTFFDELPSCCDADKDVSVEDQKRIVDAVSKGRNVVIAFHQGAFGVRSGTDGFYSAINHTATIEVVGGVPMLRNTVVVSDKVLALLGGTNLTYWPLADLNRFRKLHAGVALEMAACKDLPEAERPGCLFSAPVESRPVPWSAVRIFLERETPPSCVVADAGAAKDAGGAGECPKYPPNTVGYCAGESGCPQGGGPCACNPGSEFCCSAGFCYTRDIAGCTQAVCPPGAGRTYTNHCCCDCWDDHSKVNVYDPCRAGFLLRCDPNPNPQ